MKKENRDVQPFIPSEDPRLTQPVQLYDESSKGFMGVDFAVDDGSFEVYRCIFPASWPWWRRAIYRFIMRLMYGPS